MSESLPEREMVRCEACGDYHYKDECEIVVIRIIKGKNCTLKPLTSAPVVHVPKEVVVERTSSTGDAPNRPESSTADAKPAKKMIIPPGIASMMIDPGHPMHDQFGAKETRRV